MINDNENINDMENATEIPEIEASLSDDEKTEYEHGIKEIRCRTGMSQKAFAERFGIPLKTLRKWEQGGSEPRPYILRMIAYIIQLEEQLEKK